MEQPGNNRPKRKKTQKGNSKAKPPQPDTQTVPAETAQLVRLAFDGGGDNLFDYALPERLWTKVQIGQRLMVPFGRKNRPHVGFCVEFPQTADVAQVKTVREVVDPQPLVNADMFELACWISDYYGSSLGQTLSAMVPAAVKKRVGLVQKTYVRLSAPAQSLSDDEIKAVRSSKGRAIVEHLRRQNKDTLVAIDQITETLQCTPAPIKTLVRSGLVELVRRQELPLPDFDALAPVESVDFELTSDQKIVLEQIESLLRRDEFNVAVLHGVTGSGKTEIYLRAIDKILQQGRQALLLVPEIALTTQTTERFVRRFSRVAVLHSALSSTKRNQHWTAIAQSKAQVVIGARSAIFAPLPNLGLIVVDEEHEPSYKQDSTPRYHGRDVAVKRAQMNNIPIILGSATPSMETFHNSRNREHYHLLSLPRRVRDLPLPKATTVDMRSEALQRQGSHVISRTLETHIQHCLDNQRQIILMLNRRGHSSFIFCPACSFTLTCPNCDVTLTCHQKAGDDYDDKPTRSWVMCHYCYHATRVPALCPLCRKKLNRFGPGTQMAEEELRQKFPSARICRMDSDAVKPDDYQQLLGDFAAGDTDILLGTQMIGKGLDFPNVDLVGVLNADTSLSLPDFRSTERTFQLITQVAGRCGRAVDQGRVLVQTFLPDEPAIQHACQHDYLAFAQEELNTRQRCEMPPFSRLARLLLRDRKLQKLEDVARLLRDNLDKIVADLQSPVKLRGPVPAAIARIENHHRYQILLQAPQPAPLQQLLTQFRRRLLPALNVHCAIDMDPINLM